MQLSKAYILLLAYCIYLRHDLFVGKALQVHSAGGAGDRAGAAALADRRINGRHATDKGGAVGTAEVLVGIGDGTVGADLLAGGAAVTQHLV